MLLFPVETILTKPPALLCLWSSTETEKSSVVSKNWLEACRTADKPFERSDVLDFLMTQDIIFTK